MSARVHCIVFLLLLAGAVKAQEPEKEPIAILELGAATSWNVHGGAATFGPNFAAEVTPIENWLELEAGTTPFLTRSSRLNGTRICYSKSPWTFSRRVEFMAGVGPEWDHTRQNGSSRDSLAVEAAGDFTCSGRREGGNLDGIWNPRMTMEFGMDTSNRSVSVPAC